MKRKTIGAIVVCSAVVAALAWKASREKAVEVSLISLQRGEIRSTVANTRAGTVNTCNRARISPILGGQIATLPVDEGDSVVAGQILLELWNVDVRAQLQLVRKERLSAEAHAESACATSTVANREAERIRRLFDQGLVSDEHADTVLGQAQASEAACRGMRRMIEVSEARIELTQAKLEQTILRAPFDGTVAEINGEVGEIVTPSPVGVATLPAVDLIDTSCIFVTAPIDEVDAPRLRAGMIAAISLDAFPGESYPATIRRVAPYVQDREKQARTLDIEAEFDEPFDHLLPGYSADIEVLLEIKSNVLTLPVQAVLGNERVLILNADGILEERMISSGIRNWQLIEITDGLTESDRVVLSVEREGVVVGASAIPEDTAMAIR